MRFLRRVAFAALLMAGAGVVTLYATGHDLGPRPGSTIAELKPGSDVRFVEANGLRFGYLEQGEGPLVLFLHGYPETARSWSAVQGRVAAAGYRTVAVYMRGYAPSSSAEDYSVRALGRDIISLIEALGEERATIVGHDWGASAVYEAAFVAPERVERLVGLSVPHPRGVVDFDVIGQAPHFLYYQSPFAERLVWSRDFQHVRDIYALWSPRFEAPEAEIQDIVETFKHPGAIAAAMGYYRALFWNGDDNRELGAGDAITVPALVIAGDSDGAAPLSIFPKAASAFTGGYR